MVRIILETGLEPDGQGIIFIEYPDDLNRIIDAKTLKQHILDDIASDKDVTGWRKYRKTLQDLGEITKEHHDKWDKASP